MKNRQAPVAFSTEVLRRVRQHARSSMSAEICGVLIGEIESSRTSVETLIEGEAAQQGGSHVTFTQDTWAHIYQTKDSQYPDKRIVGWYHSHPGFGVFLSDHDLFIHRNFFSDVRQVAWVYDPHSDEEGCFAWSGEEIVRLPSIELRDESPSEPVQRLEETKAEQREPSGQPGPAAARGKKGVVRWLLLILSYLLAGLLGFGAAMLLLPRVIILPAQ
jgi:proteasome lid subunit RPN8/RPN11